MNETSLTTPSRILGFAAVAEVGTGLVLMIHPAIVVTLLLGAEFSGAGTLLGRCFGIALLGLGLACWPGRQRSVKPRIRAIPCADSSRLRASRVETITSSAGPSASSSNGLATRKGSRYLPGRTTIREPGGACSIAS